MPAIARKPRPLAPRYAIAEDAAMVFMVTVVAEELPFTLTLGGEKVHVDIAGKLEHENVTI